MPSKLDKIPWQSADSSNLEAVFYHEPSHTLCIRFKGGGVYSYITPEDVYVGLVHAVSMGHYLNAVVKAYPYTRYEGDHDLISHLNCESEDISAAVEKLLAEIKI